jgi:secreted trypsin-like serine protease
MSISLLFILNFLITLLASTVIADLVVMKRLRLLRGNESLAADGNVTGQIIGGTDAPKGFFTHQVSIIDGHGRHHCGGSLIANNIVVGAAHCVYNEKGKYIGKEVMKKHRVHINEYYRFSKNPGMEVLQICDLTVHKDYNKLVYFDYDFVLYKLCKDSSLAKKGMVVPIKLNSKPNLPTNQQELTATGWGSVSENPAVKPDELQMVKINFIDTNVCTSLPFLWNKIEITESIMCAGPLMGGGRSTCHGDSGGPLMIQGNEWNNHLLVGVTSFHTSGDCAQSGYPDVYGRVAYVIDWIKDTACSWISGHCTVGTN